MNQTAAEAVMQCIPETYQNEPLLAEILDEPIIAALMERDHVNRDWLEQLMSEIGRERVEE